jgi:hypothetical protein
MTTVIIDTRSTEAKKILEFLKTTKYSRVIEDKNETIDNINNGLKELNLARNGKLKGKTSKRFLSEL